MHASASGPKHRPAEVGKKQTVYVNAKQKFDKSGKRLNCKAEQRHSESGLQESSSPEIESRANENNVF